MQSPTIEQVQKMQLELQKELYRLERENEEAKRVAAELFEVALKTTQILQDLVLCRSCELNNGPLIKIFHEFVNEKAQVLEAKGQ